MWDQPYCYALGDEAEETGFRFEPGLTVTKTRPASLELVQAGRRPAALRWAGENRQAGLFAITIAQKPAGV
jgi:hypothetical protein